jgi:hypothetical protein
MAAARLPAPGAARPPAGCHAAGNEYAKPLSSIIRTTRCVDLLRDARLAHPRAWRAAHPEDRERERLRRFRARHPGEDFPTPGRLEAAVLCSCGDCACIEPVVTTCGFCRERMHAEADR